MRRHAIALLAAFSLAACGSESATLGPDAGGGQAHVLLGVQPGAAIRASMLASAAPPVDFSSVASLELTIERIEAHRVGGGAWVPLTLEAVTIDFAVLQAGTLEPLATGGLPAGEYNNLRIFLSSATVTFATDVVVGNTTFLAGEPYDVDIPGAQNTGLKIPTAHFSMDGGTESVVVLFDPSATTPSIGTTGNGRVLMTPVLREADAAIEAEVENEEPPAEEESSEEDAGSGSASVLIGATGGVAGSISAGGGISLAVAPGSGFTEEDIVSLRLVLCEIRAIRTGRDEETSGEEATGEETPIEGEGETPPAEGDAAGDEEADAAPACQGNPGGAAWTRIPLEATEIDLFALGDGEFAEVGFGDLPAGRYRNVRLYVSEAWITLAEDVMVGNRTYAGGEEHPLMIPSAAQNGLRIPTSHFEVDAESAATLALLFDRTSVSTLNATGNGIRMSPILREADPPVEEALGDETGAGGDETGDGGTSG